jgi:peroxiredoxin
MRLEVLQAAAVLGASSVYLAMSAAAADSKSGAPKPLETTAPAADKIGTLSPGTGIAVGQKIPDGRVLGLDDKPVTLSSLYAKGPILLVFYRGGWCPYCNFQIRELTTASALDLALIEPFHVVHKVEGKELEMMGKYGVDLEAASGRAHHVIAIPSLFLVDRSGVVRWAHSDPTFTVRPTTAQILAAIESIDVE